jgi:NADH dehydrogenase
MPERVLVTGGSGFVGSAVIDELLARGHAVHALAHRQAVNDRDGQVRSFAGGLFDERALNEAMAGCDAVIHLVGIIMQRRGSWGSEAEGITFERIHFQGTRRVVDATKRSGVRRYLHMSALGVRPDAVSEYHRTKYRAEQYVRRSGLDWTIFRPSLIHGPGGEFMQMEKKWALRRAPPFLFMPYFGAGFLGRGGAGMLQPVYVADVARAFVDALESPRTIGEVYLLGGSERVTWPALHRASAEAIVGKQRWVMPIPAWMAKLLTRLVPGPLLGFNRDQVIMSQEDNTCDLSKFVDHFGWEPSAFATTLGSYAKQM